MMIIINQMEIHSNHDDMVLMMTCSLLHMKLQFSSAMTEDAQSKIVNFDSNTHDIAFTATFMTNELRVHSFYFHHAAHIYIYVAQNANMLTINDA